MRRALLVLVAALLALPGAAHAVCATVRIQIVQEITLERQAFDARLEVLNETADPIEDLLVEPTIQDASGADASALFFVDLVTADGMSGLPDGAGAVPAAGHADLHWLIIPAPGAGGTRPEGVPYFVGATLSFVSAGEAHTEVMLPDRIVVEPMPLLHLDYFLTRQVLGDDPFTLETEPPLPFVLGTRVLNHGYGPARGLAIESGQPEIVSNDLGILVAFAIIGSEVDGRPGATALDVSVGDLPPAEAAMVRWSMISTLSGEFISFSAQYSHSDALGGELTSLLDGVDTHYLVGEPRVDLAGRDDRRDFLGTLTTGDASLRIYESDGVDAPVTTASAVVDGVPAAQAPTVRLVCSGAEGLSHVFAAVHDPGQGRLKIDRVVRADGKRLPAENAWLTGYWDLDTHQTGWDLRIFDSGDPGGFPCDYDVTYRVSTTPDTTAPTSSIFILPPSAGADPVCVTSATEHIFLAEDADSVVTGIQMKIDGAPGDLAAYGPAVSPFRFDQRPALGDGPHAIHHFATDSSGNQGTPQTLQVVVDDAPPGFSTQPTADPPVFAPSAPAASSAPATTALRFQLADACGGPAAVLLEASPGASFDGQDVVSRQTGSAVPGAPAAVVWRGLDGSGSPLPPGPYAVRLTATDPLGHAANSAVVMVTLDDGAGSEPVAPVALADQDRPAVDGARVAWQDRRGGDWDIYLLDEEGVEQALSSAAPAGTDQTDPALDGPWAAWLDHSTGIPRVHTLHLPTSTALEIPVSGRHGPPSLSGAGLAFAADLGQGWQIFLFDLDAEAAVPLTSGGGDDQAPSLDGTRVAFERTQDGVPQIWLLDVLTGDAAAVDPTGLPQRDPSLSGEVLLWVDGRADDDELWFADPSTGETRRLSFGLGDQGAPATDGAGFAYLDDGADLAWGTLPAGASRALTADGTARSAPALDGDLLAWAEEDEDGFLQIRARREPLPALELAVRPGLNLLALPAEVAEQAPMAHQLLAVWSVDLTADRLGQVQADGALAEVALDGSGGITGADFPLTPGGAVLVWARERRSVAVATLERSPALDLAPGLNAVGVASLPRGYGAQALSEDLTPVTLARAQRLDRERGAFEVWGSEIDPLGSATAAGAPFVLAPADGMLLDLRAPAPGWRP